MEQSDPDLATPVQFVMRHSLGKSLTDYGGRELRNAIPGATYDTVALMYPGGSEPPDFALAKRRLSEGGRIVLTAADHETHTLDVVRAWCAAGGLFVLLEEELRGGWGVVAVPDPNPEGK
jgi:hypothetical protein